MGNQSLWSTPVPRGFDFHHIGYACVSLEKERNFFDCLGFRQEGDVFVDETQGVKGCFLLGPGPRIELLENLPNSTTLTPWIKAGVKVYHFAYQVQDLEKAVAWARGQRAKVIVEPIAAVAFGGRRICFTMFRNGLMIEFIESQSLRNT